MGQESLDDKEKSFKHGQGMEAMKTEMTIHNNQRRHPKKYFPTMMFKNWPAKKMKGNVATPSGYFTKSKDQEDAPLLH